MRTLKWYQDLVAKDKLRFDARQAEAAELLDDFARQLASQPRRGLFSRRREKQVQGVYLHGGVGRGKTLLMDGFYQNLTGVKKQRVHFHEFINQFHRRMQERQNKTQRAGHGAGQGAGLAAAGPKHAKPGGRRELNVPSGSGRGANKGRGDGLRQIAAELAKECQLLCFDEFHISDIADAMILYRLLQQLVDNGVRFVMTSNYHPEGLYPNGLARHLFVPAIELIMDNFTVFALDGEQDYRQLALSHGAAYFHPNNADSQAKMAAIYEAISCGIKLDENLSIQGRQLEARRCSSDAVWFDFAMLCGGNRSQADYLELAQRFAYVFLSGVPRLDSKQRADAMRRFTWLVDILYDRKVRLVMSAAVPLPDLYGDLSNATTTVARESGRTLSRLTEMQSSAYLANK